MEKITSHQVVGLMEAYNAVYSPQINEDYIWESCLTEEFISEAYQTVADYLVYNEFVPGYNTAEVYMSEMAVEDIDSILFETGVLDEQYLMEADFFKNAANTAIGGIKRAGSAVAGGVRSVASGADRAAGGAVRAGQAVAGGAQRAAGAVAGGVKTAIGNNIRAGQAVAGGAQRAAGAVAGAAGAAGRKIGQELEISRKVGAGQPLKPSMPGLPASAAQPGAGPIGNKVGSTQSRFAGARDKAFSAAQGIKGSPVVGPKTATPAASARPATASPSMAKPVTKPVTPSATTGNPPLRPPALPPITGKPSLASQNKEIGDMATASRKRQGLTQSFDPFDVVLGHLIDEGYADTEEAALKIMANMSGEWKNSIIG